MKQLILLLALILGGGAALKLLTRRMRPNRELREDGQENAEDL
jgi:hypothetical protein